ncbi:hypothetical protein E2C01_061732 [Portunus trituberculatus]|uniref:Uncharacterized protein n=1 Tax=Portunus trituberculatus TaxID=210409 RepID=A0A5B7HD72_PORTR|nr:hypothetical protein [Portunus trituberculatus]
MHDSVDSEEGELISPNGTNFAPPKLSYSVIACVSHLTLAPTCTETNYQTPKHPRTNKYTIVVRISAHFLGYSSEPQHLLSQLEDAEQTTKPLPAAET